MLQRLCLCLLTLLLPLTAHAQPHGLRQDTPTEISANTPVTVRLTPGTPVDLTYTSPGGETVAVVVRSLEVAGTLDPVLEVLNATNTRLTYNDDHQTTRADLDARDAAVEGLELDSAGVYTIRVNSFSGAQAGQVEVLVDTRPPTPVPLPTAAEIDEAATATPAANVVTGSADAVVTGDVPDGGVFTYTFSAAAGQAVTITVRATSANELDPRIALAGPDGQLIAENDDHTDADPSLTLSDSRLTGVPLPADGVYTLTISGFAGTGGPFELTISAATAPPTPAGTPTPGGSQSVTGDIVTGGDYVTTFEARAGEVYVITARATGGDLDPQIFVVDSFDEILASSDDHGSADPTLSSTDARIDNLIIEADGLYSVEVYGTNDTAGSFELAIERVGTDAPGGPGEDEVITGEIIPGGVYEHTLSAKAGDYVTITVRALTDNMDPIVTLLDSERTPLADNDDHGTFSRDLSQVDSRIENFHIAATGDYTIEVNGYRDSEGAFAITLTTRRAGG